MGHGSPHPGHSAPRATSLAPIAPSLARRAWARVVEFEKEWSVSGPALFVALAGALLIDNHVHQQVPELAFWLSLALLASVFTWLVQNNHRRARVDAVTGLANRLQLRTDLREPPASPDDPETLVLLELEGVTAYRDQLGFEAADELLRKFADQLSNVVGRLGGTAYRLEGGQFSALVPSAERELGEIVMAIFVSNGEGEDDALFGRARGVVTLPGDATEPADALRIAGRRLAADKKHQRRSAKHQAHDALTAPLNARRPEMAEHLRTVAFHAIAVGRSLGLNSEHLDDVVFAARLQHIGMLAVPDEELDRQSGLSASQSELICGLPAAGAESSARHPRWRRSRPSSAPATRASTAVATRTASAETGSRSGRGFSPPASPSRC